MDDALRMNDHTDARHFDVEKPACFDHLETFVKESGGIDRDLATHDPGRMLEGASQGNLRELRFRRLAEWTARSCEPKFSDRCGWFVIETLENRGVFAIDGEHFHAMFARFVHDDLAS